MRKMTIEWGIIIIIGIICAVLAAALISSSGTVRDLEEITIEQQERLDSISRHNAELSADKLRLTRLVSSLADEVDKQNEVVEEFRTKVSKAEKELEKLRTAKEKPTEKQEPEAAPKTASNGTKWSYDRLPAGLTNTYRCEDWHLFRSGTEQELLQRECLTDIETGIRFLERSGKQYLCAAMGSAYGITIGSGFEVELENGEIINVVLADYKHDITQARADDFGDADINYNGEATTCVLEFVYDEKVAPLIVLQRGGMFIDRFGGLPGEGGNLVRITYEGRVWEP